MWKVPGVSASATVIERIIKRPHARRRMETNHLSITLRPFVLELHGRGYHPGSIRAYVRAVEHFGRWLQKKRIPIRSLTQRHPQTFLKQHLSRCSCPKPAAKSLVNCRAALGAFVKFLQQCQFSVTPRKKAPPLSVIDRLLVAYDKHLDQVCGLTAETRQLRQRHAREFLEWQLVQRHLRLRQLRPQDVLEYVISRTRRTTRSRGFGLTGALRSFLRFLELSGRIAKELSGAVPRCARRRSDQPLRTLTRPEWRRFVSSFSRTRPTGLRNYAMALCLGLLALRAGEVARLSLDDLDWRQMALRLVKTKQQRQRFLPLPVPVARALVTYLKQGRPRTRSRALFVNHRPPVGEALKPQQVRDMVRLAFARTGINAGGSHVLRRTWATWAQHRGLSLKLIADVLGHRSIDSTTRYAQLNLDDLRQAALPWPKIKE